MSVVPGNEIGVSLQFSYSDTEPSVTVVTYEGVGCRKEIDFRKNDKKRLKTNF